MTTETEIQDLQRQLKNNTRELDGAQAKIRYLEQSSRDIRSEMGNILAAQQGLTRGDIVKTNYGISVITGFTIKTYTNDPELLAMTVRRKKNGDQYSEEPRPSYGGVSKLTDDEIAAL